MIPMPNFYSYYNKLKNFSCDDMKKHLLFPCPINFYCPMNMFYRYSKTKVVGRNLQGITEGCLPPAMGKKQEEKFMLGIQS